MPRRPSTRNAVEFLGQGGDRVEMAWYADYPMGRAPVGRCVPLAGNARPTVTP